MTYAGFWRRFGAYWLDFLVLTPLVALSLWGYSHFRLFNLYYFVPGMAFSFFYSVYLVRQYGGTPGKLLAGLRIRKLDGTQVGYREAVLRYLPEWLLTAMTSIGIIIATLGMTDSEYRSLGWMARSQHLQAAAPPWFRAVNLTLQVWIWSEFVVMMTNRKRRALHDFIAGTVVLVEHASDVAAPTPELPS